MVSDYSRCSSALFPRSSCPPCRRSTLLQQSETVQLMLGQVGQHQTHKHVTNRGMLVDLPHDCCRCDPWEVLRPNNPGYTYDGVTNGMLGPGNIFRRDSCCAAPARAAY